MRKKMSKKLLAVAVSAGMALSLAACTPSNDGGDTPVDPVDPAPVDPVPGDEGDSNVIIDPATGEAYDLGGMEIIVRDWWSAEEQAAPTNEYEEARDEYREWIQETYNFTIKQVAISDWGSTPSDFVDFATSGGDGSYYVWIVRDDPAITSAMASGLMYDLSTLDCLDFSDTKYQRNKLHEQYSKGSEIYAMFAGYSEGRTGVYFNKQVLKDAGIEPEDIYDMQANGTWTWDAFDEMMGKVQRDTNNDGIDDIYGLTVNEGNMTMAAVYSNGSELIGKDASGYVYKLEDPATVEALEWTVEMFNKYDNHDPEGAAWDYYKEEFLNGVVGFLVEDEYAGTPGNFLEDAEFEIGFVMFPAGPQGKLVNCWSNNPACIANVYDAETAWKIAFAYDLFTNEPAGYEDYNSYLSRARAGIFDTRAVDETITMMSEAEHGMITYHGMIPNLNLGPDFTWGVGVGAVVSEKIEAISTTWKTYVDAANAQ